MTYELKKIDLWSAIKVSFLINLIIGLVLGIFMGLFFALILALPGHSGSYDSFGDSGFNPMALGAAGGLLIGLFYAFIIIVINGVIGPLVFVLLYNLIAGWLGGLKFNLVESILESNTSQTSNQPATSNDDSPGGNS